MGSSKVALSLYLSLFPSLPLSRFLSPPISLSLSLYLCLSFFYIISSLYLTPFPCSTSPLHLSFHSSRQLFQLCVRPSPTFLLCYWLLATFSHRINKRRVLDSAQTDRWSWKPQRTQRSQDWWLSANCLSKKPKHKLEVAKIYPTWPQAVIFLCC